MAVADAVGTMQVIRTAADAVGAMLAIRTAVEIDARSRPPHRDQVLSLIRYVLFDVEFDLRYHGLSWHGFFKKDCRCHLPDLPAAPREGGDAEGGRARGQQDRGRSQ